MASLQSRAGRSMKVVSWSKKLSILKPQEKSRRRRSGPLLRRSVSSISRLLRRHASTSTTSNTSTSSTKCSLLPLTIVTSGTAGSYRSRAQTWDRSEVRTILHQRLAQRIMERSMAALITEARHQLQAESSQPASQDTEDVYVPFDFSRERRRFQQKQRIVEEEEEDFYMTMS